MRVDPSNQRHQLASAPAAAQPWVNAAGDDEDGATYVYFNPEPTVPVPVPAPAAQLYAAGQPSFEVSDLAYTDPVPREALPLPAPSHDDPRFPAVAPRAVRMYTADESFSVPKLRSTGGAYGQRLGSRRATLVFAVVCVAVGIAVGGVIAIGGRSGAASAAPAPRALPAAPVITPPTTRVTRATPAASAPPVAPVPLPTLVTLRLDTDPAGATVMVVDDGKTALLGRTPIDAQLDSSRAYDLIFSLDNHQTVIQHVDPKSSQHLFVQLAVDAPAAAAAPTAPAAAPVVFAR